MLRFMFGEPPRVAEGQLLATFIEMEKFCNTLHKYILIGRDREHILRKIEIYSRGLLASLDEFEQSHYAATQYANMITTTTMSQMSEEERFTYYRYVYFDKNTFIRLFSLLDKLGRFLNDFLQLGTEKIKVQFSYFTVLRNMRNRSIHPDVSKPLDVLKEDNIDLLNRLRKRRNAEIHYMNPEMEDDLRQSHFNYDSVRMLEDIAAQVEDAKQSFHFVVASMEVAFQYANRYIRKMK